MLACMGALVDETLNSLVFNCQVAALYVNDFLVSTAREDFRVAFAIAQPTMVYLPGAYLL